jgi:hypothetical protein
VLQHFFQEPFKVLPCLLHEPSPILKSEIPHLPQILWLRLLYHLHQIGQLGSHGLSILLQNQRVSVLFVEVIAALLLIAADGVECANQMLDVGVKLVSFCLFGSPALLER